MPDRPGSSSNKYLSTAKESRSISRPSDKPKSQVSRAEQGTRMPTLDAGPSKLSGTQVSRSGESSRVPTRTVGSSSKLKGTIMPLLDSPTRVRIENTPKQAPQSSRTRPESSSQRIKTVYASKHDQQMASRQTKMDQLSARDRQEQEQWAQSKLMQATGACLDGYGWRRTTVCQQTWRGGMAGYKCKGGGHFVSDKLLAEGTKKCFLRVVNPEPFGRSFNADEEWYGPFTEDEIYADNGMTKWEYQADVRSDPRIPQDNWIISKSVYTPGPYPTEGESAFN